MKYLNIILRYIFSWIDAITAKLITTIYRLLSNLSELIIYSDDMIKVIGRRIGLILGIFMLFKLAISLVNYMISPDKIKDGKQGGGKLIINVGISLALLISINFIFKEAYKIQGIVVNSKVIEKIFFGNSGIIESTNDNEDGSKKMDIGYYLYTGFIYPNSEVFGDTCENLWDTRFDITVREVNHTQTCDEMLHEKLPDDARKSIYKARNTLDMSYVFYEYDLISSSGTYSDVLDFDYTPIISNVAGILSLLVLISFSMDLATRAIKLLFLQIIAPIPIISFMDTGKGQDIFKKWGKECINTYLSVFLRLIAINFAVFMIVLLRGNYKDVFVNNVWLNTFLIIGCLMFAKQIPKLLEDFFGIKSGGMVLNPLKKFEENALLGKNITGIAAGAAVGTLGIPHAGLLNGFKGAWNGMIGGKGFKESWKGQVSKNATMRTARLNGSTLPGRIDARLGELLGTGGDLARIERDKHKIQDEIDKLDKKIKIEEDKKAAIKGTQEYRSRQLKMQQQEAISKNALEMKNRSISQVKNGEGSAGANYNRVKQNVEALKKLVPDKSGRLSYTYTDLQGHSVTEMFRSTAEAAARAEQMMQEADHYADNEGWRDYLTEVSNGAHSDATLTSHQAKFDDAFKVTHNGRIIHHGMNDYGDLVNQALGDAKGQITTLQVNGSKDERAIAAIDRTIAGYQGEKQPYNNRMRDLASRESVANANKSAIGK